MRSCPGGSISSDVLRAAMTNQEAPAVGLVGLINYRIVVAPINSIAAGWALLGFAGKNR